MGALPRKPLRLIPPAHASPYPPVEPIRTPLISFPVSAAPRVWRTVLRCAQDGEEEGGRKALSGWDGARNGRRARAREGRIQRCALAWLLPHDMRDPLPSRRQLLGVVSRHRYRCLALPLHHPLCAPGLCRLRPSSFNSLYYNGSASSTRVTPSIPRWLLPVSTACRGVKVDEEAADQAQERCTLSFLRPAPSSYLALGSGFSRAANARREADLLSATFGRASLDLPPSLRGGCTAHWALCLADDDVTALCVDFLGFAVAATVLAILQASRGVLRTYDTFLWTGGHRGDEITLLVEFDQSIDGPGMFRDPDGLLNTLVAEHECVGRKGLREVSLGSNAAGVAKVGPGYAVELETHTSEAPVSWADLVGADCSSPAAAASPSLAEGDGALQGSVRGGEPHSLDEIAAASIFRHTETASGEPRTYLSTGPGAEVCAVDQSSYRGYNDDALHLPPLSASCRVDRHRRTPHPEDGRRLGRTEISPNARPISSQPLSCHACLLLAARTDDDAAPTAARKLPPARMRMLRGLGYMLPLSRRASSFRPPPDTRAGTQLRGLLPHHPLALSPCASLCSFVTHLAHTCAPRVPARLRPIRGPSPLPIASRRICARSPHAPLPLRLFYTRDDEIHTLVKHAPIPSAIYAAQPLLPCLRQRRRTDACAPHVPSLPALLPYPRNAVPARPFAAHNAINRFAFLPHHTLLHTRPTNLSARPDFLPRIRCAAQDGEEEGGRKALSGWWREERAASASTRRTLLPMANANSLVLLLPRDMRDPLPSRRQLFRVVSRHRDRCLAPPPDQPRIWIAVVASSPPTLHQLF
ncbi:hypothetical protein C8J57DRAFT_1577234 [Mycena rebaudengoi]|nr:hypothetical protein C8J57DRAFT_1577234 [Mycena rebaudengoi]